MSSHYTFQAHVCNLIKLIIDHNQYEQWKSTPGAFPVYPFVCHLTGERPLIEALRLNLSEIDLQ